MITVFQWTRVTSQRIDFPLTATNDDGTAGAISSVQCALLPYRSRGPSASTVWVDADWVPGTDPSTGTGQILIVGPDGTNPGASGLQLGSYSADLWARVVNDPEVELSLVARIDLQSDPG